jgi:SAM-dependent MidA family methyltransferase
MQTAASLTNALEAHLRLVLADQGGWIGFDRFMAIALYAPGLGYYARHDTQFGLLPSATSDGGGDFVTAPEMSRFFGKALAVQVGQALQVTGSREIWEFGAGSGALAAQLLGELQAQVDCYTIVDLSGSLQQRQRKMLQAYGDKVRWVDSLPRQLDAVVVGNEVLDAMPVRLLARRDGVWHERGVACAGDGRLVWADQATDLRPPVEVPGAHDYLTEIHPQAEGFVRMLADHLGRGAVFLIDYGFPEREYYHAQRNMGTVMCHRAHRADTDPLADIGRKDITAHVNFTGLALAAQEADAGRAPPPAGPFSVLGYTTQARFLMNCGLLNLLEHATLAERVMGQKLIMEHEMGELFKVIGLCRGEPWDAIGFELGDRTHTL